MKHLEKLERIGKGIANRRRLTILSLLDRRPASPLYVIAETLKLNFKTASDHVHRLSRAGLVIKRSRGNVVQHVLSDTGKSILKLLRALDN